MLIVRQSGFHLIEVLVSLLMISVGVLGVMKGQVYLMQQSEFINQQSLAIQYSETILEKFSTHSFNPNFNTQGFSSDNRTFEVINFDTDLIDGELTQDQYVITWQVQPMLYNELMQPMLKAIKVQTYWFDRHQKKHQVELHTIFSRHHGFNKKS